MTAHRIEQPLLATPPAGDATDTTADDPRQTLESLIQVNRDAAEGFATAAEKLEQPEHTIVFRRYAAERSHFADELVDAGSRFLDDEAPGDSIASKLHRAWISVKDALTEGDHAILEAAEAGEDHAVATYADALEASLPPDIDALVRRQYTSVKLGHDAVRKMRDSTA